MTKATTQKGSWHVVRQSLRQILVTGLVGVCVFIFINIYLHSVNLNHGTEVSLMVAIYLVAAVYLGMYLSQIWIKNGKLPANFMRALLIIIAICLLVVFFAAQFSIGTKNLFMGFLFFLLPLLVLGITTGILIRTVMATIENKLNDAKANEARSRSELEFLQSQLSPHFLFNTLNNIYGISLSEQEKVPGLLLKLSSLLRYSVYDARELFVPLKDELDYIRDYIEFEKLRIGDKLHMTVSLEEPRDGSIRIAPMLLIVFIENSFKHSKTAGHEPAFIDINLQYWNNRILFGIRNTCVKNNNEQSMLLNGQSGFGLVNVKKRLELLYTNAHHLEIDEHDGHYQVMLQLKMK